MLHFLELVFFFLAVLVNLSCLSHGTWLDLLAGGGMLLCLFIIIFT